jgi:CheY-like chemotaxis protein
MPRSILIVDDHPSFRHSAHELLEGEGYEVVGEAEDGGAALEAARVLRPDVVLLDVQLPDLDGFEVAGRLTAPNCAPAPAVIMISSREADDFGPLASESGARGFIAKADLSREAMEALLQ